MMELDARVEGNLELSGPDEDMVSVSYPSELEDSVTIIDRSREVNGDATPDDAMVDCMVVAVIGTGKSSSGSEYCCNG
jgi:hypothetical protein